MQDLPEYHWLSDSSNGDITLRVKFEKGSVATIPDKKIHAHELQRLIDPATGIWTQHMRMDDHPVEVIRYALSPKKKLLTLHVRKQMTHSDPRTTDAVGAVWNANQ